MLAFSFLLNILGPPRKQKLPEAFCTKTLFYQSSNCFRFPLGFCQVGISLTFQDHNSDKHRLPYDVSQYSITFLERQCASLCNKSKKNIIRVEKHFISKLLYFPPPPKSWSYFSQSHLPKLNIYSSVSALNQVIVFAKKHHNPFLLLVLLSSISLIDSLCNMEFFNFLPVHLLLHTPSNANLHPS